MKMVLFHSISVPSGDIENVIFCPSAISQKDAIKDPI